MDDTIEKRVKFFFDNQTAVHINTKGVSWYNGVIIEIGAEFLMLKEFKLGDVPVFFSEIESVDKFSSNKGVVK